ncbi:MAG: tetratricopeptide repeat protein, partial [Acidobacteriota bacterium]
KLLDTGETEKAIEALNQAIALDPELAEAYFKLGIAYALIEKRDETLEVADAVATPAPQGKKTTEIKTRSEEAFEKAVDAYKKLIDKNAEDHSAFFNLGRAYNKLNEDEDAAKALKQAVKLSPDDTEYQTELGAILIKLAKYQEAIPPLKKALEIDPDNSRAQELLDDAEAGRRRVDFVVKKPDEKKASNSADNSNSTSGEPPPDPTPPPRRTPPAVSKTPPANTVGKP